MMVVVNDESDLDRIYMMNRRGHRVSILIILFILSETCTGLMMNP